MPGGRVKLTNSPGGSVIKRYVRTDGGGAGSQRGRAVPGALITPSSEDTPASGGQIAHLIAQLQAEKEAKEGKRYIISLSFMSLVMSLVPSRLVSSRARARVRTQHTLIVSHFVLSRSLR